jgi:hypothetical protein
MKLLNSEYNPVLPLSTHILLVAKDIVDPLHLEILQASGPKDSLSVVLIVLRVSRYFHVSTGSVVQYFCVLIDQYLRLSG